MAHYESGPAGYPSQYDSIVVTPFEGDGLLRARPEVAKKINIAASMVQPLARAAILGSSTAAVVIGCIALAAGAAFPPTAFIALGVMAAGVVLLAAGKMMNKETSIAKNTAIEAFITASAPISGPIGLALSSAVAIGGIVFVAVFSTASLVISGRFLKPAQPPGASGTSNPADCPYE